MQKQLAIFMMLPLLVACQGNDVRNALGLEREAPDEFVIYSRPPLSLPPEFELLPPRPGEASPLQSDTRAQARSAITGEDAETVQAITPESGLKAASGVETAIMPVVAGDAKSAAESSLLERSGAANADPAIREKLQSRDDAPSAEDSKSLFESIIKSDGQEPVVDATKEVERLRKNKQEGKPVTEGEVPTLDPTPKSVIEKIF